MKFTDFTKEEYENIIEKAMLSDELKTILRLKIEGYSREQMVRKLNTSLSTLDRNIRLLKKKVKKVL